jgi:hypothetical protein
MIRLAPVSLAVATKEENALIVKTPLPQKERITVLLTLLAKQAESSGLNARQEKMGENLFLMKQSISWLWPMLSKHESF